MENSSLDDLKTLAAALEEIATCPVCHGILRRATVTCVNGHVICEVCKQEQTKCPTCKDDFSAVKNVFSQKVLEVLPHTCEFKDCEQFVKAGDDHELFCGFKPTTCKVCDWTGPGQDIITHLKNLHTDNVLFTENTVSFETPNFDPNEERHQFDLFTIYEHAMWWEDVTDTTSMVLRHTFHFIPNGKPNHDIFISVKYESATSEYSATIKLKTEQNIKAIKESCIWVPTFILYNFIDDKKI